MLFLALAPVIGCGDDTRPVVDAGGDTGEEDAPPADTSLDTPMTDPAVWPCWEHPAPPVAPPAERGDVVDDLFGNEVADPYRWLEEDSDPALAYVREQHEAAEQALPELTASAAERLQALHDADVQPVRTASGRVFYMERPEGEERDILYMEQGDDRRAIFDFNDWSPTRTVSRWQPSPDGEHVMLIESMNHADRGAIFVLSASTGELLEGGMMSSTLERFVGSWDLDSQGFYYFSFVQRRFVYHRLNTPIEDDTVLFRYGYYEAEGPRGTERLSQVENTLAVQYLDETPREVQSDEVLINDPAIRGLRISGPSSQLLALSGGAPSPFGQLQRVMPGESVARWPVALPQRTGESLLEFAAMGDAMIATHIVEGAMTLRRFDESGTVNADADIPLGTRVSGLSVEGPEVFYHESSVLNSSSIKAWNPATGSTRTVAEATSPVALDPAQFRIEMVEFVSSPTMWNPTPVVRVLVVKPVDAPMDGSTPTLLQAYGGFGTPWLPKFSPVSALWLEAGGAIAIAQIRGGMENGAYWYFDGARGGKQNAYDDFFGAAEKLAEIGLSDADHLAIAGVSNGGLTMAVAITQRPELFGAAAISLPYSDMYRYHLSGLGASYITEYGDPTVEADHGVLSGYSPYHRAEATGCREYPPTIVISAESDDRVSPWHARKLAATLSRHSTQNQVLLVTTPMAGHGGIALNSDAFARDAAELRFLAEAVGLDL